MISMLIYSCKQDEIELLQSISKDIVARIGNERLDICLINPLEEEQMDFNSDALDVAFVDITEEKGLDMAKELRKQCAKLELLIISDNTISPMLYLTPEIKAASLLLKPLIYNEIEKNVQEFFQLLGFADKGNEEFFLLEDKGEVKRIPYLEIFYFEARNKRVHIRLNRTEYTMYESLDSLIEQLPAKFMRCHRSFIVNIEHIKKIRFSENRIILNEDMEIPISRSYKADIKEVMKNGT